MKAAPHLLGCQRMNLVDRLLSAVAVLVIVASVARAAALLHFARDLPPQRLEIRQLLGLPADHHVDRLLVSVTPHTASVLWSDDTGGITAIVPDASGRLRVGRLPSGRLAVDTDPATDAWTASGLATIESGDWPALPEGLNRLTVRRWDPEAAVYITVGEDGHPGVAGVDDEGDGVVDNLSELGATDSDDRVVAPQQPGYAQAAAGQVVAQVISRGALVDVQGDWTAPAPHDEADGAAGGDSSSEVWLRFSGSMSVQPVEVCLQLR